MLGYLGVLSDAARPALLAAAVSTLLTGGAEQVVADADAARPDVIADLERSGFRRIRARLAFRAAAAS